MLTFSWFIVQDIKALVPKHSRTLSEESLIAQKSREIASSVWGGSKALRDTRFKIKQERKRKAFTFPENCNSLTKTSAKSL